MGKEVDNYDLIRPLLNFENEGQFYFLQVMQRRKDGNDIKRHTKIIKNYYIHSLEYLDKKYDEIKGLCTFFNSRACIRLNRRDYRSVSFKMMQYLSGMMANRDWENCKKAFNKACGRGNAETKTTKTWVVDIDNQDSDNAHLLSTLIDRCRPTIAGESKVIEILPSKAGFHLITRPFDLHQMSNEIVNSADRKVPQNWEVKKDNPTNLYIPE